MAIELDPEEWARGATLFAVAVLIAGAQCIEPDPAGFTPAVLIQGAMAVAVVKMELGRYCCKRAE
jgi:hypothetical protein